MKAAGESPDVRRNTGWSQLGAGGVFCLEPGRRRRVSVTGVSDTHLPHYQPYFQLTTFGVQKLAKTFGNAAAAWDTRTITNVRGGPPPPQVACPLVQRALRECDQEVPDVIADARCYIDFDNMDTTRAHIGTHPVIMLRITEHRSFKPVLQRVVRAWLAWRREELARPFRVVVYCRAGEKRSVGFASLVAACLRSSGALESPASPHHLRPFFLLFFFEVQDVPRALRSVYR